MDWLNSPSGNNPVNSSYQTRILEVCTKLTTIKMAFKYRAYPTRPQKRYIDQTIHDCWWFYRYVLHNMEDDYKQAKDNFQKEVVSWYNFGNAYHPNWFVGKTIKPKIPKEFYPLGAPIRHQGVGILSTYKLLQKAKEQRSHLKEMPAIVLQEVLERMSHAFDKFWKEGGGYPNYPKERNYQSITWTSGVEMYEGAPLLKLSKFPGPLKFVYHRTIKGKIKRANISKDILGRYFVSLMCEYEEAPKEISNGSIGIDMNIKALDVQTRSFITMSTGEKVDIPRWFTICEDKLVKIQRKMSKDVPGSPEWRKHNRVLKHIMDDISNKKDNWLHNLTRWITDNVEYAVIEDMNLTDFHNKGSIDGKDNMELAGERGQRKAWTETPFGEFKQQLTYKMGDRLIKVDPAYTSKTCNHCGSVNMELTLSDRVWKCPSCGEVLDRDINAACNIRDRGLALISKAIKR
jgi:putative transposase